MSSQSSSSVSSTFPRRLLGAHVLDASSVDVVVDVEPPVVFTETQVHEVAQRVLELIDGDHVTVQVDHRVNQITRFANNRLLSGEDGDEISLFVNDQLGRKKHLTFDTNQLDDAFLRRAITAMNLRARTSRGLPPELIHIPTGTQTYLPVELWRIGTAEALRTRPSVIDAMAARAAASNFISAGFVGRTAHAHYVTNKNDSLQAYYRETDCEVTMTARASDGKSSGWYGQAHRDWTRIDPIMVADRAIDMCRRNIGAVALEPGRRTAILGPLAVVQLVRHLFPAFDAFMTRYFRATPFWDFKNNRTRVGERMFDPRLEMSTDPTDAESGSPPYIGRFGIPDTKNVWVDRGVVMDLAYSPPTARMYDHAKMAAIPYAMRIRAQDNPDGTPAVTKTIEEMIASCKEGIYVHHVHGIEQLDPITGLITGVTRDGCFLVKDGKIVRPVKNFRFVESPIFFLNRVDAIGKSERAAFGYAPKSGTDWSRGWPRPPAIVPPLMVRDFNFTSLADAV